MPQLSCSPKRIHFVDELLVTEIHREGAGVTNRRGERYRPKTLYLMCVEPAMEKGATCFSLSPVSHYPSPSLRPSLQTHFPAFGFKIAKIASDSQA